MNNITTPTTYEVLQKPGSNTDTKLLVTHVYNLTESTTLTEHVNGTYGNYTTETAVKISYNWPVLCLFSIVVCALIGNILVCLAVRYEHKLQNMFNYFLVSLALSDMLSASIVMPLSIIKTFIGKWSNHSAANLYQINYLCVKFNITSSKLTIIFTCYANKTKTSSHLMFISYWQ